MADKNSSDGNKTWTVDGETVRAKSAAEARRQKSYTVDVERDGKTYTESVRSDSPAKAREYAREQKKLPSYRKGGKVRKSGPARLHRGEMIKRRGRRSRSSGRY